MRVEKGCSVKDVIDRKLYPCEKFPRTLFPNLVSILTELFHKYEKANKSENGEKEIPCSEDFEKKISQTISLGALLNNEPGTLALIYKDLIFKFIFKRHANKDDVEEIVQEIITRFLHNKIDAIRRRFNFDDPELPTFTSYFMVTVRNIYIDIIRKETRGNKFVENEMEVEKLSDNRKRDMLNTLILEEEFKKFNALIKLYHRTGPKLNLTLKIKYNIPIEDTDILSCFPDCSEDEMDLFIDKSGNDIKNRRSMERIVPIFNKYEGKSNNPDTLRKWISTNLEEIKRQMNKIHSESPYNNSTISDLIILYYKWQKHQGV